MASYQVVIILLMGFFLLSCNCSRLIPKAEQQHITEDDRLSQDTYNPPGRPANHVVRMIGETQTLTRLADETGEKTPTSEKRLSWKLRQLSNVSAKKKSIIDHGNNKPKGNEAPDCFSININIPPKLQEPERARRRLLKTGIMMETGKETKTSTNRRFLSNSSENKRVLSSSQSTTLPNHDTGGIMEMDYSPAHKRPPIHNEVLSP